MNMELRALNIPGMYLEKEVLDGLTKSPCDDSPYTDYVEFVEAGEGRTLVRPIRKPNTRIFMSPSVYGKSTAILQHLLLSTAYLTGEDRESFQDERLDMYGIPLEPLTASTVDFIRLAVKKGWVPDKNLGDWSPSELDRITEGAIKTFTLAQNGNERFAGINGRAVGTFWFDFLMCTASQTKKNLSQGVTYTGHNRLYTFAQDLMQNTRTRPNTFFTGLITDAKSQQRRLLARAAMHAIATPEEARNWMEEHKIVTGGVTAEELAHFLPGSGGTIHSITVICRQMDELILQLDEEGEIGLESEEKDLLQEEVGLIRNGLLITSPEIFALQDRRMVILDRELYPHIYRSLKIPKKQRMTVVNIDVDETADVHFFAEVSMNNNLVRRVWG